MHELEAVQVVERTREARRSESHNADARLFRQRSHLARPPAHRSVAQHGEHVVSRVRGGDEVERVLVLERRKKRFNERMAQRAQRLRGARSGARALRLDRRALADLFNDDKAIRGGGAVATEEYRTFDCPRRKKSNRLEVRQLDA